MFLPNPNLVDEGGGGHQGQEHVTQGLQTWMGGSALSLMAALPG